MFIGGILDRELDRLVLCGKLESKTLGIPRRIVDPDLPIVVDGFRPPKLMFLSIVEKHQYVVGRAQFRFALLGINVRPPNRDGRMIAARTSDSLPWIRYPRLEEFRKQPPERELVLGSSANVVLVRIDARLP